MLHCPAAEFMWSHISICRTANRKVALYEKNKNKNQTKLWLVKVPCHMLDSLKANQSSDGVQWTPNLPKRQSREQAWNSSSTFISVFTLKKSGRGSLMSLRAKGWGAIVQFLSDTMKPASVSLLLGESHTELLRGFVHLWQWLIMIIIFIITGGIRRFLY